MLLLDRRETVARVKKVPVPTDLEASKIVLSEWIKGKYFFLIRTKRSQTKSFKNVKKNPHHLKPSISISNEYKKWVAHVQRRENGILSRWLSTLS